MAMWDGQLASDLALSPEHLRALGGACQERAAQIRTAFQPPRPGQDPCEAMLANRDRIEQIRKTSDDQLRAILSPEEQNRLAQARGRPLPLEPPIPPGCRG
jgi:hypothetical protein